MFYLERYVTYGYYFLSTDLMILVSNKYRISFSIFVFVSILKNSEKKKNFRVFRYIIRNKSYNIHGVV